MSKWILALACLPALAAAQNNGPLPSRDLGTVRIGERTGSNMPVTVPRAYAIVIGISTYKNLAKEDNLSYAAKDAENVYNALLSKEGGNIAFDNVTKLIGPQATLANMRHALEEWLPSKAQPSDRVIVFFVGHGVVDASGKGYLAPYDIDTSRIAETA